MPVRSRPRQQYFNINMENKRKTDRGGAREGAGGQKPLKYGEETVNVTFRVPVSKKEAFRKYGNAKLKTWMPKNKSK